MRPFVALIVAAAGMAQSGPPVSPLARYLELTPEQGATIARNGSEYSAFATQRFQRSAQVQGELTAEMSRDPLDPLALGARFVEIETIRREIAAAGQTRAEANRRLMTAAQQAKLRVLEQSRRLRALAQEAVCTGLLDDTAGELLAGAITAGGFAGLLVGSFVPSSRFALSFVPQYCYSPGPPLAISLYLDLTDRQAGSMAAAVVDFGRWQESRLLRSQQVQAEIDEITGSQMPGAADLGLRYAEIETIRREIRAEQARTGAKIRDVLAAPQKDRIKPVSDALSLAGAASQAECEGLIDPGPESLYRSGGFAFSGIALFSCGLPGIR